MSHQRSHTCAANPPYHLAKMADAGVELQANPEEDDIAVEETEGEPRAPAREARPAEKGAPGGPTAVFPLSLSHCPTSCPPPRPQPLAGKSAAFANHCECAGAENTGAVVLHPVSGQAGCLGSRSQCPARSTTTHICARG